MSFKLFNFHPKIDAGIRACNYDSPTLIQKQAIPPALEGCDILGLAQTGTGKTAAFVLPILQRLLDGQRGKLRALIIAPTRELTEQIHENISMMAIKTGLRSVSVYGGVSKQAQVQKIRKGVDIVVACPGRLLDHLSDGTIKLTKIEYFVLDEADRMFDMGFLPDIRRILKYLPKQRQTLLFAATMPEEIRHLAEDILVKPTTIQIGYKQPVATISHFLFSVEQARKAALLRHIIDHTEMRSTLIFTRTKHKAKTLGQKLERAGYSATSIQGDLPQSKRKQALDGFRRGRFKILVATDIAARGIDVSGISHVINYDMPDTVEAYTHRIGRTGRAACTGEALTFAGRQDNRMINMIELSIGKKMTRLLPGFDAQALKNSKNVKENSRRGIGRKKQFTSKQKNSGLKSKRHPRSAALGFAQTPSHG